MYLILKKYSRPRALDEPWFEGEFLYRNLVHEGQVAGEQPCTCGLFHAVTVLLKDGSRICADSVSRVRDLDPALPIGEWSSY
jgi:hypothetical protein